MEPHRHDDGLLTKALARCRSRLDHDGELQRVEPSYEARARLSADARTSLSCLTLACELYAGRPCLGERAFVVEDGRLRRLPELRYLTYAELWARVRCFASGLRHLGLCDPGALVGLCGHAGVDWVVADLACLYLAAVSVPLQTTAAAAEIGGIVAEAGLGAVVCSLPQLELVAATLARAPKVGFVVVMDVHEDDLAQAAALALSRERIVEDRGTAVAVLTMAEVERLGRERAPVPAVEAASEGALRTIVYTSGSTGSPKGAMFPESVWGEYWRRPFTSELPIVPHVSVEYMPLNHMAGRGAIIRSLMDGGATSFVLAGDMSTLFEDIRIARPTTLFLVPRVASMIHQHFQTEVLVGARAGAADVMEEMGRSFLGDRLAYMVIGTAPTAPEVFAFLERCFQVPVFEVYGSTEAGSITVDGRIDRENVTASSLVDVPELGYRSTDVPYPRGELCLRTRRMVPGYYKNPEATRDLLGDDGTLHTGDVVEQRGPDEVAWIDRKKNVLKLSQGEFVSTSRLEELYAAGSPLIRQIHIYGSSLHAYLLAVVVPEGTTDKARLRGEIQRVAAREGLRSYEIPRDILVEADPFTQANGLLTESNKPSRARLRARYEARLSDLYASIEQRQIDELAALARARTGSAEERVVRALAATLGLPEDEVRRASDRSFHELGGDSLGAARAATLIHDLCDVEIPVGLVLDPTSTVRGLCRNVEERLAGKVSQPGATFASVHGAGAETVRAEDLRLDHFLTTDELTTSAGAPAPAEVVLLTGANGFLGRFLLLALLERAPRPGGKVIAMVRAPSDEVARERLAASYRGVDPTLPARFAALAAGDRLEVLAGDLIQPRLGLSRERWERLAGEVDVLVHNGALVNHAFSYAQLFEPNVLGTVEVIRLALRRRLARVSFISSVGVASGLERASPVREDEDAASLWQRRPIDSGYAVGYATSKWAGEILLRDLEARSGVPVTVFRCSMILPPRGFIGQVNAGDFLTRLLHGVVVTGLAPRSFYAAGSGPHAFDGLPVDFAARAIAGITLGESPHAGYGICHVVQGPTGGGASLDTFVDWVAKAGYAVQRVDDYATWLRAFRERLESLSPLDQQRSPLPILRQWERPSRGELTFDNRRLQERLAAIVGAPVVIPDVDALFVQQYLKNMVYTGLIQHPGLEAAA